MKIIRDYRAARKNGNIRPLWQIPIAAVLMIVYWPADKFVRWMDNGGPF